MFNNRTTDGRNNICGINVAKLRKALKISQRELADRLQVINLDIDKNGCALHDPLAVGVSIDPTFVQTISLFMKVNYDEHNYGRTIGDNSRLNDPNPNVKVAVNVDKERYLKVFMERLNGILKEH